MDEEENFPITSEHPPTGEGTDTNGTKPVEDQEKLESKRRKTSLFTIIVISLVLASFFLQGFAIGFNVEKIIIIISGVLSIVVSSTAAAKQIIMQRLDTLRAVHNKIRLEVNRFMLENNKLTRNVDGLEDSVIELQHLERHLARIAEEQDSSAKELVQLVKENKEILKQQKIMAKAELQEQLLATVLRTDRDGDLQINEREANVLILRMKNYEGIELDEERVRNALVTTNGSLPALLNIIRGIAEECCGEDSGEEEDLGGDEEGGSHERSMSDLRQSSKKMVKIDDRKFMESFISMSNYSQSSSSMFGDSGHSVLDEKPLRRSLLGDASKRSIMTNSSH